jgi:sensor domain CHASE-containing protein
MGRIFSFISLIVILMTALTGTGVFYLSQNSDQQIKEEARNDGAHLVHPGLKEIAAA